jgi:DNA-directed RNA polymerase specialized sigma24 family protein
LETLKDLPSHLRIVVVLRYYSDLTEREIARAICRQPGTVKSRLNEARRRLAVHPALQVETPNATSYREGTR